MSGAIWTNFYKRGICILETGLRIIHDRNAFKSLIYLFKCTIPKTGWITRSTMKQSFHVKLIENQIM